MNAANMFEIYKNYYIKSKHIDDLEINLHVKSDTQKNMEILKCELIKYEDNTLEATEAVALFEITENIGQFFLNFINLDVNYLKN